MKLAIIASVLIVGISAAQAQITHFGGPYGEPQPQYTPQQQSPFGGPNAFGNYDVYDRNGHLEGEYQPHLGGGYTFNPHPGDINQ